MKYWRLPFIPTYPAALPSMSPPPRPWEGIFTWRIDCMHPEGFYEKYPEVTWDLAAERWAAAPGRSRILLVSCRSCGKTYVESVLAKPERCAVAEFIIGSQHWYSCTVTEPEMSFIWLGGPVDRE